MPRVLILGATGYIGRRLADDLVRSGEHAVYGVTRSKDKAKSLALAEITPIICPDPVNQPEPYLDAIRKHRIDTVVDAAGAFQNSSKFLSDVKAIGEERLQGCKTAGIATGPKLGFVYCSGTWIHGSSTRLVSDVDAIGPDTATPPPAAIAWRVAVEKEVLAASDVLDVAIVRPALIYGRESTIWTTFILPLLMAARSGSTDTVKIPLSPDSRPALIHVDDVASGLKIVIEKLPIINSGSIYPVFDLVTSQESMEEIFNALAATWDLKASHELTGPGGDIFAQAVNTTTRGSSQRAKQLLGWEPTRLGGFTQDMDIYASAFASQF